MKVLFFTKYTSLAANTRYRCLQYLPYLQNAGINCEVSPLLGEDYLTYKFEKGGVRFFTVLKAYASRLWSLRKIKSYDLIVLHYELFPYFPPVFEWLLSKMRVPYVCDYDDAIFHNYDSHTNPIIRFLLKNKIAKVIHYSRAVLAGNKYLAQYASQSTNRVSMMPTVVDIHQYRQKSKSTAPLPGRPFTIGWIGSPSTSNYVLAISGALKRFCLNHNARVVLVGSGPIEIPGLPLEIKEWNEESELDELYGFDVGIMPLTNDPWARGKCGFKLIQYMACKLPTVASPVGVNSELVTHGVSGYLAKTEDDWVRALEFLYENPVLRNQMGERGYETVNERYNLSVYAPKMQDLLREMRSAASVSRSFRNVDLDVTQGFGDEWNYFQQERLSDSQLQAIFEEYFRIFPWKTLPKDGGVGVDVGCGSGRWAKFIAPRAKHIHCLEASDKALEVAKKTLSGRKNVSFHFASVGNLPFADQSLDFAYCIGVLHHIPDPQAGITEIGRILKPGAPLLFYIYYSFENRGPFYRSIWKVSEIGRFLISRLPFPLKYWVSEFLAAVIYWPLARFGNVLAKAGVLPESWTLSFYRDKPFYVMRTDALDRFGTRLEKRFTRAEITEMLHRAGFEKVEFANSAPYWVGVATKS